MHRHIAALVLLLSAETAAQTFLVDANNGPGTNFLTIAAATASVPSGSVLLVRPGVYGSFAIDGKSLKVLGDPGATLQMEIQVPISISNLQPGQRVVVRNFDYSAALLNSQATFTATNCLGAVYLDRLRLTAPGGGGSRFEFTNCEQVLVRNHQKDPGIRAVGAIVDSNVVLEGCQFGQASVFAVEDTITQTGGTLQVVDGFIDAAAFAPNHAVFMTGGDLRVLGASTLSGTTALSLQFAIGGTGTVRIDPSVVFLSPATAPSLATTTVPMAHLTSSFTGGQARASLDGPLNQLGALLVALPGPVVSVPGFADPLWGDPASTVFLSFGVITAGNPVVAMFGWNGGSSPGIPVIWHALTWGPTLGFQVSPPSLSVLP